MTDKPQAQNSTNVRSRLKTRLLRRGLRVLSWLAPELAALQAERMFLRPRRHARPERENDWLASAERGEVRYRKALLPTYSWGRGPAVLLVHGWEGRATQLGAFVPALLAAGYRVVAVDMPGHGAAEPALSSEADFAFAMTTIIQRLGPFHAVIAHSMGAAATTLSHALRPFQGRLVLIGAPRGPRSFFNAFMNYLGLASSAGARVERRIVERYGMPFSALDVADYGARVTLPVLLIHDRGDKEVPFAHAQAFLDALPNANLVATEGLGHRRILRDPAIIDLAVQFIGRADQIELRLSPAA
jgi:pimeloyl-ACP methyl ester carboxylesterase